MDTGPNPIVEDARHVQQPRSTAVLDVHVQDAHDGGGVFDLVVTFMREEVARPRRGECPVNRISIPARSPARLMASESQVGHQRTSNRRVGPSMPTRLPTLIPGTGCRHYRPAETLWPGSRVTSKLADIQRLTRPRMTSELIDKRHSLRVMQPPTKGSLGRLLQETQVKPESQPDLCSESDRQLLVNGEGGLSADKRGGPASTARRQPAEPGERDATRRPGFSCFGELVHALRVRPVAGAGVPDGHVRAVCGRRGDPLRLRAAGPACAGRAHEQDGGGRTATAPGQDPDRVLQGRQTPRRLRVHGVHVPRIHLPRP
jgi:hypothetical protein